MAKTNQQLQKQLDIEKWYKSVETNSDNSGRMKYCKFCDACIDSQCVETQRIREAQTLCAKAHNKMKRAARSGK